MSCGTPYAVLSEFAPSPERSPAVSEIGVLGLVPDEWHWQWQPRHQVMTRLARYFNVLWMNPAREWRQSFHSLLLRAPSQETPISGRAFVVHTSSPFFPVVYRPGWLATAFLRKRLQHAREILVQRGCKKIVLYLWRPEFAEALDLIAADLVCYHIDDEYSFSDVDAPTPENEERLIARAGQVFIHSPALLEKKGKINPRTCFVPNGVDFNSFALPAPEPPDMAAIPRPRVGYTGHLKRQLDWPLLLGLAMRHPEWSFVFVGAPNQHPEIAAYIEQLSRMKNAHFLGGKTAQELSRYPQHFDVCVMPYRLDGYTRYIYPLKLHEYLAGGRPVVGTPIASLLPFREVLALPESADQWSSAISDALSPFANAPERQAARQALASQHDWEHVVLRVASSIAQRLGRPYADHFQEPEGLLPAFQN